DRRVARFVEERASRLPGVGSLDDCVVSAVDARAAAAEHAGFAALIVATATRRLEGIAAHDLVPTGALRSAAAIAVAGGLLLAVAIALGIPPVRGAIETARFRLFPPAITVDVLPGDVRVVGGHSLNIRARVRAEGRDVTQLSPQLVVSAGAEDRTMEMTRSGNGFEFEMTSIDRSFRYRVRAGTASSPQFTVTALFPPRVQRIEVRYVYPPFSRLAVREEQDGGDIYAPAGTRVRVRVHADKPLASGQLAMSSGTVSLKGVGTTMMDVELVLARDDVYRVRLEDADGLTADGESQYFIRLMDDRPPDVRILRPASDQGITPLEEVTIEARADDDYGVSSFELVYAVGGGREHVVPFARISGTPIQKLGAHLLAAEELSVRPGDVITYYARARDIGRGKRSTETKSDLFFLEVKPFTEEFVAAQSQSGAGQSGDPQIDSLISAQKEIITATWNVERRSQGGRSAADISAIAKAQAELKARAQRRRTSSAAMAAAVEAMTRAIEQLGTQKTREALPHEMAALNGLLQAQADVQRRQVTQQASGAGNGGSNRSGQDLSALFDKELQRQQRTNYEQRSQIEERPDQQRASDDALDRIKDLARRQEEINRRQRDLAQASADERKRELEKLSRDQEQLRQRAQDLARDAAEQMRTAANEMRRDDSAAAGQSGMRAAEQLRRMERQMRGGSVASRQRESAERQIEAQQIAQEQRRISAEEDRLDKGGEGNVDARRRLASEKNRLAARVEALERAGREVAGEGDSRGGRVATEARKLSEQLDRTRDLRNRLDRLEAQMGQAQGRNDGSLAEIQQQYAREMSRARQAMGDRGSGGLRDGVGASTPEQQEFSRSAPGTEAFKQDRSDW
ncbi:MAG: hypothetical protein H0U19_15415, partial [Acidobacteria bacterium]|nr:hypothetical protein [Acidobacteriota bacterium]